MKQYNIWYQRPEQFQHGIMGVEQLKRKTMMPNVADLSATHIFVRNMEAEGLEEAYLAMQAEAWSPNGEARETIATLGLMHTSMSVGDVLVEVSNPEKPMTFIADMRGFVFLKAE